MNNGFPPLRLLLALALALALGLAACGARPAEPPPLAGTRIGGPFTLIDQDGRPFASTRLAGAYPIVYFGYTFCPDVCPTDLAMIGKGLRAFEARDPARAAKVVPVFISVDPARDRPAVLKQFVAAFHPRMIGLTGSEAAIAAVAKDYAIFYQRKKPAAGTTGYMVDHSRQAVLFGPDGTPIVLVPADAGGDAVAETLATWVR